jgi:hypothetical protein
VSWLNGQSDDKYNHYPIRFDSLNTHGDDWQPYERYNNDDLPRETERDGKIYMVD